MDSLGPALEVETKHLEASIRWYNLMRFLEPYERTHVFESIRFGKRQVVGGCCLNAPYIQQGGLRMDTLCLRELQVNR